MNDCFLSITRLFLPNNFYKENISTNYQPTIQTAVEQDTDSVRQNIYLFLILSTVRRLGDRFYSDLINSFYEKAYFAKVVTALIMNHFKYYI